MSFKHRPGGSVAAAYTGQQGSCQGMQEGLQADEVQAGSRPAPGLICMIHFMCTGADACEYDEHMILTNLVHRCIRVPVQAHIALMCTGTAQYWLFGQQECITCC